MPLRPDRNSLKKQLSFLCQDTLLSSFSQLRYYRSMRDETLRSQVHARLPTGQSALQVACGLGLIDTAKALLDMGEDFSHADDHGWTPLHSAASYGRAEIVQQLIEYGANIEKADNQGWTPLFWATIKDHVEAVRTLLRNNASIQATDKSGWTAVDWTAYKGDEKMIKLLNPAFSNDDQRVGGRLGTRDSVVREKLRPLFLAVEHKNTQTFDAMLECNTKPASKPDNSDQEEQAVLRNKSLFHILNKNEMANYRGSDSPNTNSIVLSNSFLVKLLDSAIKHDHLDMVKMVLERGVDLGAKAYGEVKGRSVLHTAAFSSNPHIPAILLRHGASPSQVDRDGYYPLDLAAINARDAVLQEYLQVDSTNIIVKSHALHHIWSNEALMQPMRSQGDSYLNFAKKAALPKGDFTASLVKLREVRLRFAAQFIALGADVNKRDRGGNTPLQFAMYDGTAAVELLCSMGADVNIPNNADDTLLHIATRRDGSVFVVQPDIAHLLSEGANPNLRNRNGETVLHLATRLSFLSDLKTFIHHGAEPNVHNVLGANLLHFLAEKNFMKSAEYKDKQDGLLRYLIEILAPAAAIEKCHIRSYGRAEPSTESYFPFERALYTKNEALARQLFNRALEIDRVSVEALLQEHASPTDMCRQNEDLETYIRWKAELENKEDNAEDALMGPALLPPS